MALPRIFEFIIFGSTARVESVQVNDLDIALLVSHTDDCDCKFVYLPNRLDEIMRDLKKTNLPKVPIDFSPLWIAVLWDEQVQQFYRETSKDPNFVSNILKSFLRWDRSGQMFVPTDREYLKRYDAAVL